jgi:DNA-binding transcriptional LysR family regulator
LEKFGMPRIPEDLQRHNCLRYVWGDQVHASWSFHLRRWATASHGITNKPRLDVSLDINAGRLTDIFPQSYGEPAPLNLVTAHRALLTPALQQLRDYLKLRCSELVTPK